MKENLISLSDRRADRESDPVQKADFKIAGGRESENKTASLNKEAAKEYLENGREDLKGFMDKYRMILGGNIFRICSLKLNYLTKELKEENKSSTDIDLGPMDIDSRLADEIGKLREEIIRYKVHGGEPGGALRALLLFYLKRSFEKHGAVPDSLRFVDKDAGAFTGARAAFSLEGARESYVNKKESEYIEEGVHPDIAARRARTDARGRIDNNQGKKDRQLSEQMSAELDGFLRDLDKVVSAIVDTKKLDAIIAD